MSFKGSKVFIYIYIYIYVCVYVGSSYTLCNSTVYKSYTFF